MLRSLQTQLSERVGPHLQRGFSFVEDQWRRYAWVHDVLRRSESGGGPPAATSRRRTVFAEGYNPENDRNEKVCHPKTTEQRQRLTKAVENVFILNNIEPEQLEEVIDALQEKRVRRDELIISQGEDGDYFYVIGCGSYEASVETEDGATQPITTYTDDGSFGELALMYNTPRAATVRAATDGVLWTLDRQTFRRIVMRAAYLKRRTYDAFLKSVPLLDQLSDYERYSVADALQSRRQDDGACVVRQGDVDADGMYFIESGLARVVYENHNGTSIAVGTLKPGQYFGELALITKSPRKASVYAVGTLKVAFLDVAAFVRLLGPCVEHMTRDADRYEEQLEVLVRRAEADCSSLA